MKTSTVLKTAAVTLAPIGFKQAIGIVPVTKKGAGLSLDETMAQHAKAYTKITNAAKKSLETFKDIGDTLLLIRSDLKAQESTEGAEDENEGSGEAGTGIEAKTLDVVELTEKVLALAEANNIETLALIKALQASLKA